MKKISFLVLILLGISSTYATYTTTDSSNWYPEPILDSSINFKATLDWGKVYTSWSAYNKDEGFVYYKVVRSADNSNPVYPDNGYIYYTSEKNTTEYIDSNPLYGTAYYRVCAITSEKNRYCSNVVKIYKEKPVVDVKIWWDKDAYGCYTSAWYSWCEVKSKCIRSWEEKCQKEEKITDTTKKITEYNLKQKAEKLVNSFIVKVEKTFTTTEKRISVLNTVIEKLNKLAETKPAQKQIIDFIVIKLKAKIELYQWSDLGDIESIFNDIE